MAFQTLMSFLVVSSPSVARCVSLRRGSALFVGGRPCLVSIEQGKMLFPCYFETMPSISESLPLAVDDHHTFLRVCHLVFPIDIESSNRNHILMEVA